MKTKVIKTKHVKNSKRNEENASHTSDYYYELVKVNDEIFDVVESGSIVFTVLFEGKANISPKNNELVAKTVFEGITKLSH